MKIALISPESGGHGGGIHTFYRPIIRRWAERNGCVVIVGSGTVAAHYERKTNLPGGITEIYLGIARLNKWRKYFSAFSYWPELQGHLSASWAMQELALEFKPDIVEVCDIGLQFVAWVANPTIPYIIQMHGSNGQISHFDPMSGHELESKVLRLLEASLLSVAHSVQCSSIANKLYWESAAGICATKIDPALEVERIVGIKVIDRSQVGSIYPPIFRVTGRLQRWKGAQTAAEALQILGDTAPVLEWYGRDTLFGRPGWRTSTELQATFPNVFGRTLRHFAQVSQEEVYRLQASCLCNVIPSLWDTFNFTVAEAMASGRPVICSRGAGASELIDDGVSGLLFDAGDAAGLAEAMRQMLAMQESERQRMSAAAVEVVRERLDPDRNAAHRLDAYRAAMSAWREPRPPLPGWLAEAVSPETGPPLSPWPVLDGLPLKGLLSYTGRRLARRLIGMRSS